MKLSLSVGAFIYNNLNILQPMLRYQIAFDRLHK